MPRVSILWIVWLTVGCSAYGNSNLSSQESPLALIDEINRSGAPAIVRQLWANQSAWKNVTTNIATGRSAWIDVALALSEGADAGASASLGDAMFQALVHNPSLILQEAEPQFPLELLCGGRSDPLPTYKAAATEMDQVREAVQRINSDKLQAKKDLCLAKLREGEVHLKRFFEVNESAK